MHILNFLKSSLKTTICWCWTYRTIGWSSTRRLPPQRRASSWSKSKWLVSPISQPIKNNRTPWSGGWICLRSKGSFVPRPPTYETQLVASNLIGRIMIHSIRSSRHHGRHLSCNLHLLKWTVATWAFWTSTSAMTPHWRAYTSRASAALRARKTKLKRFLRPSHMWRNQVSSTSW